MPKPRIDENLLFERALEEFSEYSYEEASINRIMKNAGVSKGSFYYRFENKYQLYLHILKHGLRKKWEFIRAETGKGSEPESDIFSLFFYQAELSIRFASAYPRWQKLAKMFSREKGSEVYSSVLETLGTEEDSNIEIMINTAFEKGEFSDGFSRDFVAKVLGFLFRSYDEIFPAAVTSDSRDLLGNMKDFVTFLKFGLAGSSIRR